MHGIGNTAELNTQERHTMTIEKINASKLKVGHAIQIRNKDGEPYSSARYVESIEDVKGKRVVKWASAGALNGKSPRRGGTAGTLEIGKSAKVETLPEFHEKGAKLTANPVTVTVDENIKRAPQADGIDVESLSAIVAQAATAAVAAALEGKS